MDAYKEGAKSVEAIKEVTGAGTACGACLDEIEELKITDMEIECNDGVETVSGEMRLDILVEGYAHWDGSEEYLGTEETEIRYKYSFEMMNGKVISEIELEMS